MADESKEKSKWIRLLKKENFGKRLLVAICLLIALSFFIHFREVRIEMPELGSVAKTNIVTSVDFEVPDREGTVILKQESAKDIGPIYEIVPDVIEKRRLQFENRLIQDARWRNHLPNSTFEEMNHAADVLKKLLSDVRFSDTRTLDRLETLKLLTPEYFLLPSSFNGNSVYFSEQFWSELQKRGLKEKKIKPESIAYIIDAFQEVAWPLGKDLSAQSALRKLVKATVSEKYRRVEAGTRIVNQGEKITESQMTMIKAMKKALDADRKLWEPLTLLSSLIFASIVILLGGSYLHMRHKKIFNTIQKLSLYATIIILTLLLSKVTEYFFLRNSTDLFETVRYPLFIPFAAILFTALLNVEIALFSTFLLSVLLGFSLAVDPSRFITINVITGIVAILSSRSMRKRKEVFVICAKVWLACVPVFFVYSFARNIFWSALILSDFTSTFAFLVLTSILIVGLLPVFESIFGIMTDITLMEYMDPNNELLRRLSIEAPGTYQHSLVVGSVAEAAAHAIGANGLFCRVSAMYHDIGKLSNPHCYTENQMGGFDIHQLLTPEESKQVIMAHVTEGIVLAKKYGLPRSFTNIIREHHGTSLVYYFYCKQVEQMGGDVDAVDEEQFRYAGPKPRSRESAIIMMSDTVEAASRSLKEVSEEVIAELAERLIGEKLEDGQFDDCELTFKEFGIVKQTIIRTLAVARHIRITYPEKQQVETF